MKKGDRSLPLCFPPLETLPRLAILAGPAGIGKTRFCLENFSRLIHESKTPLTPDVLYLLPSAEHRERILDLTLRKEGSGFFGARVVTFNQLMRECLKAGDFSLATDAQCRFLLSEILARYNGEYFSAVRGLAGFLETMSDFLGELKESMVSLEAFRAGVKKLKKEKPEWSAKYEDLLKIYEAYEGRLESLGLRDHRDGLFLLKETAAHKRNAPLLFRHLFVDGFFDFSRSQLEFLSWLRERSERLTLALTVDLNPERSGLFEIPLGTLAELEKIGFHTVNLSEAVNQRAISPALRHIEKHLFCEKTSVLSLRAGNPEKGDRSLSNQSEKRPVPFFDTASSGVPPRPPEDGSAVFAADNDDYPLILEATGIRGEIEMIARQIRRLARTEQFYFSDIAVILRRIGEYEGVIRTVFRDFDIPVEIHERERLRGTPPARTLARFFRILLDGWKREDLFNFLKSSYVEKDYAGICSLEIEALDLGIVSGRERWLKEIDHPLLKRINSFQDRFQAAKTVEEWIRLTREVVASFELPGTPRDFAALNRIQLLLEEIRSSNFAQGSPGRSFEDFAKEFLGLIEIDLFSLHDRNKNRVQVYDISLARQKEYKVVFLAGLLEKSFPVEIREDPILSDEERRAVALAERLPRQAVERYFFYLALTRAQGKIILSYPRFDLEGREALPSFYVDEVKALFSEPIPTRSCPVNQSLPDLEEAVEEREVMAHLVRRLFQREGARERKERALSLALYNRFLEKESFQILLGRVLYEPAAQIRDEKVKAAFFPRGGIFKPTGLETYGRCAYRYFASEILRLEEKEEGIDPKQVGIVLHKVLERYWRERVEKGRKELEELEPAKDFVRSELHRLLAEPRYQLKGEKAYRIKLKKSEMESWLAQVVEREIEEGGPLPFAPRHFEFEFGFSASGGKSRAVDYLRLYDPYRKDLLLRGKIDRIDVDSSGEYGLVVDYKTAGGFKKSELEFGTALQLPLYLLAIQKLLKLKPAGGEIHQIKDAKRSGFYSRSALDDLDSRTSSRNVLEQKQFDEVIERAVRFAYQFSEGITKAEIPVRPRDCVSYCPFPSLCRIEKWRLPFIYQEIHEEDKERMTKIRHSSPLRGSE